MIVTLLTYRLAPVDALQVPADLAGVRTMVSSFHHMDPATARRILQHARDSRQAICIYEISDNGLPIALWWMSLPMIFLMVFFLTPFARPLTWKQLVFTYLLPVIPLCFAWDGAVSNARTYTLNDLDQLLTGLESDDYHWEKGLIAGKAKNQATSIKRLRRRISSRMAGAVEDSALAGAASLEASAATGGRPAADHPWP